MACAAFLPASAHAERFSFVTLGDTAYNPPADYPTYEALIDKINASDPAFTIHVGDTFGAMDCREPAQRRVLSFFQRYDHPLFYTPGDNEWVDCVKPERLAAFFAAGGDLAAVIRQHPEWATFEAQYRLDSRDDALARLADIRRIFFARAMSLGQNPVPLVRQSDVQRQHRQMVENARWEHGGVLFGTIHVAGSGNNYLINHEPSAREAMARNDANIAWVQALFAEARARNAPAVVLSLHASLFDSHGDGGTFSNSAIRGGNEGPYQWLAFAIREQASAFGKPVLLINGDFHDFVVDRPFMVSQGEGAPPLHANITRLQVYGAPEIKAVSVSVDTETPWVFSFSPLY